MLGCQLVFHCPDSLASRASVAYVHCSGTPGKAQVKDSLAVADDPSRETEATVTLGFSGPMPAMSGWNRSLTAGPAAPMNGSGESSFALRPAASAAAVCSAVLPSGSEFGFSGNIPHPATAKTSVSSTYPSRGRFSWNLSDGALDTGQSCHLPRDG